MTNWLPTGPWNLSELQDRPKNNLKVFSCFSCGGGSTMGYKLSGYEVIGCCEIDPQMLKVYQTNHKPKYPFLMGVQDFKNIPDKDLPSELFELDILDGSPPCSSFSMAGSREKKWGKKSHFREGQAEQNLDDLFFEFIEVAKKLKPKVVVAEIVKGLIQGNARGYVKQIFQQFREAGYSCQLFLLNASRMGVPQKRERTFFIANRLDKKISLEFNEELITIKKAFEGITTKGQDKSKSINYKYWEMCKPGENFSKYHPKGSLFNHAKLPINKPANTLTANYSVLYHYETMRNLSSEELIRVQTFPEDYKSDNVGYICGMSVPPYMMNRVSYQIAKQFFNIDYDSLKTD